MFSSEKKWIEQGEGTSGSSAWEFHRPPSTAELPDPGYRRIKIISPTAQFSLREIMMFSVWALGTIHL
jgi:hypothetical protein